MSDHEDEMTQAERIRWLMQRCDTREEEIADLQERLNASTDQVRAQHIDIATLKAERDEARREVSKLMGGSAEHHWYANRRGWDCFKQKGQQ